MPGLTNYLRGRLAEHAFRGASTALPGGTYVTLLTSVPTTDGTLAGGPLDGVEWSPARIQLHPTADPTLLVELGSFGGVDVVNEDAIVWDSTATSGLTANTRVVGVGIWDSADNLLAWDHLTRIIYVTPSSEVSFPARDLKIRLHKEIE